MSLFRFYIFTPAHSGRSGCCRSSSLQVCFQLSDPHTCTWNAFLSASVVRRPAPLAQPLQETESQWRHRESMSDKDGEVLQSKSKRDSGGIIEGKDSQWSRHTHREVKDRQWGHHERKWNYIPPRQCEKTVERWLKMSGEGNTRGKSEVRLWCKTSLTLRVKWIFATIWLGF